MDERRCLVCGQVGRVPHFDLLLRCTGCGFVTARLDQCLDPRRVYEGDYFTGGEYLSYLSDETFFKKTFRGRLNELLRRRAGGRLLEIGTAYGFFLDLAKEHFQVVGYEMNPAAAHYARSISGLDVRTDDFLLSTPASLGGPVDVTVMWDVIEHLERPDLYLAHIANLSRPGAILSVTTGDIGSVVARLRGRRWRMIHPPTHVHYFSRSTLARLLANYGFRVLEIRSVGVARSLRQILYSVLVLRLGRAAAYKALEKLVPPSWGFTLNTFDIIQVVGEKSEVELNP
jgi:SAM-dependent methyltransferase